MFTILRPKRTAATIISSWTSSILPPPRIQVPWAGRSTEARARITWDGGEQIVTIDKPLNEPGANCPMWKWQVCDVDALGLPAEELPSDRVTGMHTGHPDEAPGNTLFHHSFSVTFLKVRKPDQVYTDSGIYGVIHNAAGRTAQLLRAETVVSSQVVAGDETFRFTDLGAGEYTGRGRWHPIAQHPGPSQRPGSSVP